MNGYVRNKSVVWLHCMKREVSPNGRIPLNELYKQYGKKHGLGEGEEFISWLRAVKLKDKDVWEIVFAEKVVKELKEKTTDIKEEAEDEKVVNTVELPMAGEIKGEKVNVHSMTVQDVVGLSVRKGREIIPLIMDVNLLKYALQEANQLVGKDSLCQVIRKRLDTMSRIG